jgi:hypothetical protein
MMKWAQTKMLRDYCSPTTLAWSGLALVPSLGLAILLAFSFLNSYENWGDDWAQYMLQAQAILNHDVMGIIHQNGFMMRHSASPPGPVAYPWGLPFLLAVEGALFSFDLHVFKFANILIFLLLVVAVFGLARHFLSKAAAIAVASMFAFNPVLLHYYNHVLSELPFTLASVCAFTAMENSQSRGRSRILWQVLTGSFVFAAVTLRTNGILMLAAVAVRGYLPKSKEEVRHWRDFAVRTLLLPYLSFGALFVIWNYLFPGGGGGYLEHLRGVSMRGVIAQAIDYPISLFDFFTGGHHSALLLITLGPLVVLGALTSWGRTAHFSVYGLLTLALYVVWPESQGYRFMIPVTPFMVILMVIGLEVLARWNAVGKVGPILASLVKCGVPIVFLIVGFTLVATGRLPRETSTPYDQASSEMFRWIRSNTAVDAVISFFKPRAMHLLGKRICLTALPADVRQASYLVYTKGDFDGWNGGQPSLREYQEVAVLTPAFENQNFIIYRIAVKH